MELGPAQRRQRIQHVSLASVHRLQLLRSGCLTLSRFRIGFHSFIVIASSNEYARKILNSPTYAEPCLVASAKKVLCPDNW